MVERLPVFVYGTLRAGAPNAEVLDAHAVQRLPATLAGHRLHELEHPCVVEDATSPGGVVHGELAVLDAGSYADALAHLDWFEGFDATDLTRSLYVRERATVETSAGPVVCWVYLAGASLRPRLDETNHVASGTWSSP